ncbi:MAG: cytochrome B6 [Cyanobacteria bacterium]|nr:cytochrome B6 [Cyanobacteriota bacterium]MDW8202810.1 cytochrome b6-f complex subunit PetL [Cyanobacteriota bacterium SKYGB_h_bin112]
MSGVIAYLVFLGLAFGAAVALLFTLRAVKLI